MDQLKALEEEKQKIQQELELSRYLCEKQLADLKVQTQDINSLQKTMVRNMTSATTGILIPT